MKKIFLKMTLFAAFATMFAACDKDDESDDVFFENGVIKSAFSISDDKQIYFSQGNLQYQASTNTWRFAQKQYDMIGNNPGNTTEFGRETTSDWIDMFGWGTSSWDGSGAKEYQPYSISTEYSDYCSRNLTGSYANADWGVYNAISNGGNQPGLWRTLTKAEWEYLINSRSDASKKLSLASINGVNGLILLPDKWILPDGIPFSGGLSNNNYSLSDWHKMEKNGAVFLPATGYRYGTNYGNLGAAACYWSSSALYGKEAYCLHFQLVLSTGVDVVNWCTRENGFSVRLVKDVE